jgi:hypothetical protein
MSVPPHAVPYDCLPDISIVARLLSCTLPNLLNFVSRLNLSLSPTEKRRKTSVAQALTGSCRSDCDVLYSTSLHNLQCL